MIVRATILMALLAPLATGCTVATLPFKATSKIVDWSTTSQAEADRNRGRQMRHSDEAIARRK